jgi:hypothetical protein
MNNVNVNATIRTLDDSEIDLVAGGRINDCRPQVSCWPDENQPQRSSFTPRFGTWNDRTGRL